MHAVLLSWIVQRIAYFTMRDALQLEPRKQSATSLHESASVSPTGTHGRKVYRRMRSRFQEGCLQKQGEWVIVRFYVDTPGGRVKVAPKVCRISEKLTKSEQRRIADRIIRDAGVNDTETIVRDNLSITFAERAEAFLEHSKTRKKDPISQSTYDSWRSCLDKWLLPNLGNYRLPDVHNGSVKNLVTKMSDAGLSAKSLNTYVGLVKLVVASLVDPITGEPVLKRNWNHGFMDLPSVDSKKQKRPTITPSHLTELIARSQGWKRMMGILGPAAGLRIAELTGINVEDVLDNGLTLKIHQQVYGGKVTEILKTPNAYRVVDIHSSVASELIAFIGDRKTGLVFCGKKGHPFNPSNIRNRWLYPTLAEIGAPKAGPHAWRRFRQTHLRKERVPETLNCFWLGWDKKSIADLYDRSHEDVEYRKLMVEQAGIGFEIPPVSLNSLRNSESEREEVAVAA